MNNRLIFCTLVAGFYALASGEAPKRPVDTVLVKGADRPMEQVSWLGKERGKMGGKVSRIAMSDLFLYK